MMLQKCQISYGKEKLSVSVPENNLIGVFQPREAFSTRDETTILKEAMESPVGLPKLGELAKKGQKVAIVVDDNTRPTPTAKILRPILEELQLQGIKDEDVTIVFANGSHRLNTREEQIRILGGEDILNRFRICDHDPHDVDKLRFLGKTSRGTPVHINQYVADADLRILTGLIKPHSVAGYTGGGKSILPGVSSMETIISDHNYEATGHPNSILGVIEGNPFRKDIEEAAHLVFPCFIVNVILDEAKNIVGAVAGDMIEAHREGVKMLNDFICVPIPEAADIIIAGCSYPTSVSLYQASNGVLNCTRLRNPIVKEGGIIILAAPCPEGVGGGPFHKLMKEASTRQEVLDKISQPGFFLHDQWQAQLWTTSLLYADAYLVSDGIDADTANDMKATAFKSVEEALTAAMDIKGEKARITVLSDSPYTIPSLII